MYFNVLVILVLLLFQGCAPNRLIRSNLEPCTSELTGCYNKERAIERYAVGQRGDSSDYSLEFVELDDQGQLRDRSQFDAVLNDIRTMSAQSGTISVVFVHGWHHSAREGDGSTDNDNVNAFRDKVELLASLEQKKPKAQRRKVVGVYIGWRGDSISVDYLNLLTFWDRKATAEEIGRSGLTEVLVRLEEVANVRGSFQEKVPSRFVVIGHSFGGAAVYSSVSQIMADRFVGSKKGKSWEGLDVNGFGDLVVLINPAFEALRFAPVHDLGLSRCSYLPMQKPNLVMLTSVGDTATGNFFPLGRMLNTAFEVHDSHSKRIFKDCNNLSYVLDEGEADRTAVGHFKPYRTHELEKLLRIGDGSNKVDAITLDKSLLAWAGFYGKGSVVIGNSVLRSVGSYVSGNPFWNVRVSKGLIPDHNDIWGADIGEFVISLIANSVKEGDD